MKQLGRKSPYSSKGISRVPCARCGKPSSQQWQICANDSLYLGVCTDCDVELNRKVLKFMRLPNRKALMIRYKERMRDTPSTEAVTAR